MQITETKRLRLRRVELQDAPFMLALLNEPSWLRFIGDRNAHTVDDAKRYIRDAIVSSYERLGYGLYLVVRKEDDQPIGLCGFVKRDALDDVDLGFALRSPFVGHGYAMEAARAALDYGTQELRFNRMLAVVSRDNERSIKLLEALGFRFERAISLTAEDEVDLYTQELNGPSFTSREER
jgi:RimJ/RimL family protein N-acetyltransferase